MCCEKKAQFNTILPIIKAGNSASKNIRIEENSIVLVSIEKEGLINYIDRDQVESKFNVTQATIKEGFFLPTMYKKTDLNKNLINSKF